MFDLKIVNGKIVDGSGRTGYLADVGISGDRITAVGNLAAAPARGSIGVRPCPRDRHGTSVAAVCTECRSDQCHRCAAAARATGTPVVDMRRGICGDRAQCLSAIDGLITFRDAEHVTSTFAASLADELDAGIQALPA